MTRDRARRIAERAVQAARERGGEHALILDSHDRTHVIGLPCELVAAVTASTDPAPVADDLLTLLEDS